MVLPLSGSIIALSVKDVLENLKIAAEWWTKQQGEKIVGLTSLCQIRKWWQHLSTDESRSRWLRESLQAGTAIAPKVWTAMLKQERREEQGQGHV